MINESASPNYSEILDRSQLYRLKRKLVLALDSGVSSSRQMVLLVGHSAKLEQRKDPLVRQEAERTGGPDPRL